MSTDGLKVAVTKMQDVGVGAAAIASFERYYRILEQGISGYIRESEISPLPKLPHLNPTAAPTADDLAALDKTVLIKLNGGLGTSMGLQAAKSLLPVRNGLTFLDIIARQVLATRAATGARLPLIFMNSFRTADDTEQVLAKYPELAVAGLPSGFLQNQEPKLHRDSLSPVDWPADPELEWCPPGHGDIYPALFDAGLITELLKQGYRFAFVSNADNLGATPDARMAGWFAQSGAPFAVELSRKTPADIKGGQVVVQKHDGRLVLREIAQTHPDDLADFMDANKHKYFNTNNLWLNLAALQNELARTNGVLELPLIANAKTVDPADPMSPAVIQLESAMGAAVGVFPGATAIEVGRERFLPVKTTADLLLLQSDIFELTDDYRLNRLSEPPLVKLSPPYQTIAGFQQRFPHGSPRLRDAKSFTVDGDYTFGANTMVTGAALLPPGTGHIPDNTIISG